MGIGAADDADVAEGYGPRLEDGRRQARCGSGHEGLQLSDTRSDLVGGKGVDRGYDGSVESASGRGEGDRNVVRGPLLELRCIASGGKSAEEERMTVEDATEGFEEERKEGDPVEA